MKKFINKILNIRRFFRLKLKMIWKILSSGADVNFKSKADLMLKILSTTDSAVDFKVKHQLIEQTLFIKDIAVKQSPDYTPSVGEISFGDLRRLKPISGDWGFKRGGPVDRYYIENFLTKHSSLIRGRALEVKDDDYLRKFGGSQVTQFEILDVDANNPKATVIADLANADHVPANSYDCIVLTQVLQLIFDLKSVIKNLHRILKPGGVLLITVPGVTHFLHRTYAPYWCWSFTEKSIGMLLEAEFSKENITIESHGNVLAAISFLHGVGAGELTKEQYDYIDRDYQLVITAKAVKKG